LARRRDPKTPKTLAGTILAACILVLATTVEPAEASFPGANGKIAFQRNVDGAPEIYIMNPDGSKLTRLTNTAAIEKQPSYSPDGRKIAFVRDYNIFIMNANGTNKTQLTNTTVAEDQPTWSPDGTQIAYARGTNDFQPFKKGGSIYVTNADGTGKPTRLTTRVVEGVAYDFDPAWSPDGTQIAFSRHTSYQGGSYDIYTMNVAPESDTNQAQRLTDTPWGDVEPSWSPNGAQIVFSSIGSLSPSNLDVFVMNADGSNEENLTNTPQKEERGAVYSPSGTKIAFARYPRFAGGGCGAEIYKINVDGANPVELRHDRNGGACWPDWQPLP
jgi:Tol biopolymer transport system component